MTLDDIRREERAKVYAEVIQALDQLAALYKSGVPALPGHPINDEAKIAVPLLEKLKEGLERRAGLHVVSDDADRAQEREQLFLARAMEQRQRPQTERPLVIEGVPHCRDCVEPLSRERIAAHPNAARCVECQTFHEKHKGR